MTMIFGSQNLLRLASNLILTRILFPEAFGLMAIIFVIIGAINAFSDLGIKVSIIQDKDGDKPLFLDTAWSLQIIRGILLAILIWLASGSVAAFYEQPVLADLLAVAGLAAIIQGFNSTKLATADRELQLGRAALLDVISQAAGLVVTVLLALWMQSVWALVIGYLLGALIMMLLSHIILKGHLNRLAFHLPYARKMFNFGVYIFLSSLGGFLLLQGDRAILGKVATLEELALYNIGFILASVPLQFIQLLNGRVFFPLFAKRPPGESRENWRNISKMRWLITGCGIAGLFFIAIIGQELVILLYDPRYHGAGTYVALIALGLMPTVITVNYSSLPLAAGDSKLFALVVIGSALVQTIGMLAGGIAFGIDGVILGFAVAPILYYPILVRLVRSYKGADPMHDAAYFLLYLIILGIEYTRGTFDAFLLT
jgi:O-antigen/teichoic acid export membrane protein